MCVRFLDNNSSGVERLTHFTLPLNAPQRGALFSRTLRPPHTNSKHPVGLCANRLRSHARRITAGDTHRTPELFPFLRSWSKHPLRESYARPTVTWEIFFLLFSTRDQLQSLLRPKTVLGPELVHRDHDCKTPLTAPHNKPGQHGQRERNATPGNNTVAVPFR